jgi:hypothetical protein
MFTNIDSAAVIPMITAKRLCANRANVILYTVKVPLLIDMISVFPADLIAGIFTGTFIVASLQHCIKYAKESRQQGTLALSPMLWKLNVLKRTGFLLNNSCKDWNHARLRYNRHPKSRLFAVPQHAQINCLNHCGAR